MDLGKIVRSLSKNTILFWGVAIWAMLYIFSCRSGDQPQYDYAKEVSDYVKLEDSFLEVATVADGLEVPWGMTFFDDKILFTEIKGNVKQLDLATGQITTLLKVSDVFTRTTPGLLDIVVQKGVNIDPHVIINYTAKENDVIISKLVRYTYQRDTLINPVNLLSVRGANGHNGARLLLDDQNILYWATGDVADNTEAQDSTTLNGKILRMTLDGEIPPDNPIPGSFVYAWGFRNMQGLTIDKRGNIFTSEHGDAIEDEINLIKPLHNYGWPAIEGMHDTPEEIEIANHSPRTEPIRSWTPVVAPAGLAYYGGEDIPEWKNTLLLVTLKSQSLRVLHLDSDNQAISREQVYFSKKYGRMRTVLVAPNNDIYLSTSNRDWNPQPGFPLATDDKIIRIRRTFEKPDHYLQEDLTENDAEEHSGQQLYNSFCASCHKEDGLGVEGTFPPLKTSTRINDKNALIELLLKGSEGRETINGVFYEQGMASFSFLKDEELAAIINYVKAEFGDGKQIDQHDITNKR